MFLDIVGTVGLCALAVVLAVTLVPFGEHRAMRMRMTLGISAWFIIAVVLGVTGAFASPALPVGAAVGIAVFLPVLVGAPIVVRTQGHRVPLTTLVLVNAGRILGAAFLLLHAAGRLPATFANSAGWGDVATGVLALPVAWAIQRRVAGWRWITGAWNVLGMADLLAAVTLGVGSAPGSMVRFIYEAPGSGAIVTLPWVLVPAFFVPLYLLAHIGIFAQLAASAHAGDEPRLGHGGVQQLPAR
jgi:hypothetical protein